MLELIFDRTAADAENRTLKGQYQYSDINRIASAVNYLASELNAAGYLNVINLKDDYTLQDCKIRQAMAELLAAIQLLKGFFPLSLPLPASMRRIDWQGANEIEYFLMQLEISLINAQNAYRYSGTLYAGETATVRGYTI